MTLRFIHAADLHLDSPFTGIKAAAPENVATALYSATFDSYNNIIDLCITEQVDALLVAGDIYDGADRSLRAQRAFIDGLRSLDAAGSGRSCATETTTRWTAGRHGCPTRTAATGSVPNLRQFLCSPMNRNAP